MNHAFFEDQLDALEENLLNQERASLPSLISVSGVPLSLIGDIFRAAANLYRMAPWGWFEDETVLEIRCPEDAAARYGVWMGAAGEVFGLSVNDSLADLQRMYREFDPLKLAEEVSWLTLVYDQATALAPADLEAIEKFAWTIASEAAYPGIARVGSPGAEFHPPTQEDLFWLAGALPALNGFLHWLKEQVKEKSLPEDGLTLTVQTLFGPKQARVRLLSHPVENLQGSL